MSRSAAGLLCFLMLTVHACKPPAPHEPVLGEAFAGPANLPLRQEIPLKSVVVATVHFGDRLQVVQKHRHLVKVRTAKGLEGWVDERLLLDDSAMKALKQLSTDSTRYPSQGKATTYDLLNVHTEANRQSPSFIQIQPNERVDVITHRIVPKNAPVQNSLVLKPPQRRAVAKKSKKSSKSRVPPPPLPPAPKPPDNWVELSREREGPDGPPEPKQEKDEPAAPPDDWTLVRKSTGQCGWVLTHRIFMAIPDEVAQYAEGKRITSYFSLGKTQDGDKQKDIWLWTTIESGVRDHDFDSYRVFVWSLRHHRYETAYIQRRITGFYPVRASEGAFSVVVLKDDGKRYRQKFSMIGNRVKFDGSEVE